MLKKFLVGTVVALALLVGVSASAADFGTTTLKVGSKGPAVVALQTLVGATADGSFGPMTKAKVMVWQAAHGLTADGLFGAKSKAVANGAVSGTLPAGCTSAIGFSSTTGVACSTVTTLPAGCAAGALFSATTGASCTGSVSTGALTGGAGSLEVTKTSADVQTNATESKSNVKVLGFKIKAVDSDVSLTNLKLVMSNTGYNASPVSSEKLADYVDSVGIYMGDTKIGSADAADFTKTSGSPDEFSKSIALTNAVVKEGKTVTFYVEVSSGSIDSDNLHAKWEVSLDSIRFIDATGVVTSDADSDVTDVTKTFGYEDSSYNDLLSIKTDSSSPDATTIAVDSNKETKAKLIGAFKLNVDADSSDVTLNEIPVVITFDGNDTPAPGTGWADSVISTLYVEINGTRYDAELAPLDDKTTNAGAGYATYRVDLSNSDVTIDAGDTSNVKIYADFASQDNYKDGTSVLAKVYTDSNNNLCSANTGTDCAVIDAEGADTLTYANDTLKGTFVGEKQTLNESAAAISGEKWVISSTGNIIDFFFTVNANNNEDFDVLASSIIDDTTAGTATVTTTSETPRTNDYGVLSKYSGDSVTAATAGSTLGFKVADGDTTTFRVRYNLTTGANTNGLWKEITITSVAGTEVADDTQKSPTATININN